MITSFRHEQTRAREYMRTLSLPGSVSLTELSGSSNKLDKVLSPYFQRQKMREEAPGRNTHLFLTFMKSYITGFTSGGSGGSHLSVTVFLKNDDNTAYGNFALDLTDGDYTDMASLKTAVLAAVNTFCDEASLAHPGITYWPVWNEGESRSESSLSLSVQTSTGAVGTQVSTDHDALVVVDLSAATTASIAGSAAVDLVLEVAPTNSATPGDWVTKGRTGNAQTLSLAIALQSVQTVKGQVFAYVPKGYYVKVRSTGASGTVSTSVVEARKILL